MPRILFCLALIGLLARSAQALELGETREQLLAKHGAPGAEDRARNVAMYFWDGWSAQVEFQDNTVGRLTYRRNWYLGETEISSLLQANGGASRWKEVPPALGQNRQWSRDDGAVAICLRNRPLSMTFQVAGLAAAAVAEPQVLFPTTPPPESTKAPTYPRLLGSPVEPELPVADAPKPPEPKSQPLPKLPATEIPSDTTTARAPESGSNAPPAPKNAEPKSESAAPARRVVERPPVAVEPPSHSMGYELFVAILIAALGGGGYYLYRRRTQAAEVSYPMAPSPSTNSVPIPTPTKVAKAAPEAPQSVPGIEALRLDQFEMLIGEIFRRQDYTVELSAAMSVDGAIDVTLRRDSETILVQCKHWKMPRVTEAELREFYGAMTASGAPRGIIVTTGTFAVNAQTFAEGKNIELMDGSALAECLAAVARPGENLLRVPQWIGEFIAHARIFDPECPTCHGTMTVRHNRANGAPTWCCRSYPRCPGRREPRLDLLPASSAHSRAPGAEAA